MAAYYTRAIPLRNVWLYILALHSIVSVPSCVTACWFCIRAAVEV